MVTLSELASDTAHAPNVSWVDQLPGPTEFSEVMPWAHQSPCHEGRTNDARIDSVEEAFTRGEIAGRAAAAAESKATQAARDTLRLAFKTLDAAATSALSAHLADTVSALCAQVIDLHLIDRKALTARCQKLAETMASAPEHCTLYIHPGDRELLDSEALRGWKIQSDAALERGDLRLAGPDYSICDGPSVWRKAIREALNQ